ncbi:MAG: hypothetical protein ABI210_06955 [Abditibacteriaceae bacterium]
MDDKYQLPSERQREKLCDMLADAMVHIRALAWAGDAKHEEIADLADAFHNLPREIYGWGTWNWDSFRRMLQNYQIKYFGEDNADEGFVAMLDKIRNEP